MWKHQRNEQISSRERVEVAEKKTGRKSSRKLGWEEENCLWKMNEKWWGIQDKMVIQKLDAFQIILSGYVFKQFCALAFSSGYLFICT